MRIALCQINPTVGDLERNRQKILSHAHDSARKSVNMAVFPELSLCGYPPRDLLLRSQFIEDERAALQQLAHEAPRDISLLVGFVEHSPMGLYNAVAVIQSGAIKHIVRKRLLPTYDVFDEDRYFIPGKPSFPIEIAGTLVGITICEDIWNDADARIAEKTYPIDPLADLVAAGANLIVNLSASPFTLPKRDARSTMLAALARKHHVPIVFVNQVGGNDDLLFDGDSAIYKANGEIHTRLSLFAEDMAISDLSATGTVREQPQTDEGTALSALTMGTLDYSKKCGFRGAVLGLSGGIDSSLVACIATRALGKENILGVSMPTRYTSQESIDDAQALANALGIQFRNIPIDGIFQTYLDHLSPHLSELAKGTDTGLTEENIQSRIRSTTLMALSNQLGLLLLTTGNKSEIGVGYCTLYGDMSGGLAVLSDVPKTFVYRIAHEVNRQADKELIPKRSLTRAPSAELRPNQTDQDTLPPYETLDAILERYVEDGQGPNDIIAAGFDRDTVHRVIQMVRRSEYKRRQMPPGLILTRKAFGPGRRYPIAQGYLG